MITLNRVDQIVGTAYPGELRVHCNITDTFEGTFDAVHTWKADDTQGVLSALIAGWMVDNPGFEVVPYAPPTAEEAREAAVRLTARQLRMGLVKGGVSL